MRIHSIEDLILAGIYATCGWAVEPQVRDIMDDIDTAGAQNPNALEMAKEELQKWYTGEEEVDRTIRHFIETIDEALAAITAPGDKDEFG